MTLPVSELLGAGLAVALLAGCATATRPPAPTDALAAQARALAQRYIIVDGHVDVPYRMTEQPEDISRATAAGDFDFPRARAGGLDAPFMSIYIPSEYQERPGAAFALADSLIDMVEGFVRAAPDKFAIATTPEQVRQNHARGIVSLPLGMENGAPLEDLAALNHFYDRGIRYVTLTHGKDNHISDSSYDTTRTWNGLSPYGEELVRAMNRKGVMVDVSHVSDSAFFDVLRVTRAPVIASHSSARYFTPGWERNMSDEMIRALGENGGVIMINFGSSFLKTEYQAAGGLIQQRIVGYLAQNGLERTSPEARAYFAAQRRANPVGTVQDVADHIDHAVRLAGIDHVGLGSDFDGVFALPAGLQDVAEYPNLIAELLRRGYAEADVAKILGGNALRVWEEVERAAQAGR